MTSRLVLLGTKGGPAIRPGGPSPTSSLLDMADRKIVVDCGLGVARGLVETGMRLSELDLIFITHLHSDHVLELGPLIHTAWTAGLDRPVKVYGPVGTADVWLHFCASLAYDIETRIDDEGRPDIRDLVTVLEHGEGPVLSEGDLTVSALRVDHPPVTDCFALKFEGGGRTVVFSSDTAYFPPLAAFGRSANLLVHEGLHPEGLERLVSRTGNGARLREHLTASHTFAEDVGRIAADAGVGRLVLHHLVPADDPEITAADWERELRKTWKGPLTIGSDGLVLPLD
ncbi:MAG: MBL fold metallo-hydrolase [Rhizobiales bacterium]|nr:MBL fold metallo-hydrolase [Hyphomicrobiales bacterium]MBA67929.1 MBL fold metallo-hydrolase [Hyphomicrobiales bacterium]|tara:strand:- start:293 stop:1147 length:855 start_codon:yes stop_codon:yes gene_type:complete